MQGSTAVFYKTPGVTRAQRQTKARPHTLHMLSSTLLLKEKPCQTTLKHCTHDETTRNDQAILSLPQSRTMLIHMAASCMLSCEAPGLINVCRIISCNCTAMWIHHPPTAAGTEMYIPLMFSSDHKKNLSANASACTFSASHSSSDCPSNTWFTSFISPTTADPLPPPQHGHRR